MNKTEAGETFHPLETERKLHNNKNSVRTSQRTQCLYIKEQKNQRCIGTYCCFVVAIAWNTQIGYRVWSKRTGFV
jgi:hypothetical protein